MKTLTLLILVCFLVFSGCGKTAASQKTVESKKDVEITMWLIGSEGQALTIKELANE
ncbi:MAG: hypothetical protein HZA30_03010, partial [Candidatus Omnitrophica bacterium]|nr:hypothetical protein [Candidatus Omnitrophota bacterium]